MVFFTNTYRYRSLVTKAQAGDPEAFRRLFEKTHQKLFGYAAARMRSRADATDLVEDTFVDLWRSLAKFDYRSDREFMAYLFLILKRKLAHYYRTNNNNETAELKDNMGATTDTGRDEYGFETILKQLKPEYREVLQLRYWSDLKFDEIAAIMEEKINTIKTWHRRAIQELHKILNEYE